MSHEFDPPFISTNEALTLVCFVAIAILIVITTSDIARKTNTLSHASGLEFEERVNHYLEAGHAYIDQDTGEFVWNE